MKASNVKLFNLVVGVIVIAFAALLLTDGVISNVDPSDQLFSLAAVKGIVGFVLVVLAASYFQKIRE